MKKFSTSNFPVIALLLAFGLAMLPLACSSGNGETVDAGTDADAGGGGDEGPQSCTSTAECPLNNLCIGGLCQPGEICSNTEPDCPNGYECNFLKEVCVPEATCTGDGDCTEAPMTHCLVSDGVCVECTDAAHCGNVDDYFCNDAYQCEGVGPDCSADDDCEAVDPNKPYCGADGKCYACVDDGDCTGGQQVCELNRHVCVDCYLNGHCNIPSEPMCYVQANICVECLADTHCAGDLHCNLSIHECTEVICETTEDCSPGLHCKEDTGDCVQCLEHAQCGSNQWCRDFSCQTGCLDDLECQIKEGEKHYCNDETQRCYYAECTSNDECASNPDGTWCSLADSPVALHFNCVECLEDSHCDEYFECDPVQKSCRPQPCYSRPDGDQCPDLDPCFFCDYDGECKPQEDCYDANHDPDDSLCCRGYTCNTAGHCAMVDYCDTDTDCPVGWNCADYHQCTMEPCCDPACGSGEFCNGDCECESGCHDAGEACDPFSQNCCEGLYCSFFPPVCKAS